MKKVLLSLLLFLTCINITNVKAEEIENVNENVNENVTKELIINSSNNYNGQIMEQNIFNPERIREIRSELDNYGVRKPARVDSNSVNHILRTPIVNSKDKIYDFSNVLTDEEEEELRKEALKFLDETGIELIIVTINQTYSDQQIEDLSDDFFDFNDFGISEKSKSYDGILAIRNTNNYNRYYYISTSGIGQIYFTSSRVEDILDDMYDNMHMDNYYEGFKDFISSARNKYKKGVPSKYKDCYVDQMGDLYDKDGNPISWEKGVYRIPFVLATIISALVSIIVISIMVAKNKMVKKAVNANDYLDENSVNYTSKQDRFVSTHTSSYRISSSSGGGGSHHSSGGFSHGGGGRHC